MDRLNGVKGSISYLDLYEILGVNEYQELCKEVEELVAEGHLIPVKKEGMVARKPCIYKKYRIAKKKSTDVDEELIKEIKSLSAYLDYDYYLKYPDRYIKDRKYIQRLDKFLLTNMSYLDEPASMNERSMKIWGEEKYLKDNGGMKLLSNLKFDISKLNIYETPEPFFSHDNKEKMENVLIIENKDTWHTAKRLMQEGYRNILGLNVDVLIYGEGKKIEKSIYFLEEGFKPINELKIYYWGDIDFEGISIFNRLKSSIENVTLLKKAYEMMIDIHLQSGFGAQDMKEKQKLTGSLQCLKELLSESEYMNIEDILLQHKYIPQEIIDYRTMKGKSE